MQIAELKTVIKSNQKFSEYYVEVRYGFSFYYHH